MNEYGRSIRADLTRLGVSGGDSVLVHSSLHSLGKFENRAQILIDALMEVLGPEGNLLLPALSYESVTPLHPSFDIHQTPSCVGGLTEYFRHRPDVYRSLHPTHSVCATGKSARDFIQDHHLDSTPCGEKSPFRLLMEADGYLLFLGCGMKPNTSMHGVEEFVEPVYLFGETLEYTLITADGKSIRKQYRTHGFNGYAQRYDRLEKLLNSSDYLHGKVLEADAYLIKTRPMWEKAYEKLVQDPLFFVDKS